jgi:hypothetical protein
MTAPTTVVASWWRCVLVRWAFRLPHEGKLSRLCWRVARMFATENTHAALAAYTSSLIMNGILNGEM